MNQHEKSRRAYQNAERTRRIKIAATKAGVYKGNHIETAAAAGLPHATKSQATAALMRHFNIEEPSITDDYIQRAKQRDPLRPEAQPQQPTPINADEFSRSNKWRRLRYAALKRYGARCHACGATRATGAQIDVDHIKPRSRYPELALDPDNLQILCRACNEGKHDDDETDWRTPADTPPANGTPRTPGGNTDEK